MQLGRNVEVIGIGDGELWALDKPAGTLSHPNKPGDEKKSLIEAPYDYEKEAYMTDEGPYYLLHRLDGPTSGVILITPNLKTAKKVKELFQARKVKKTYNAVVVGKPPMKKGLWRDKLTKQRFADGRAVRGKVGGGAPAETQMYLLKEYDTPIKSSLLELQPLTGRTHQLRIQCSQRKTPIVGDATYGNFELNKELKAKKLLLHAKSILIESMNFYVEAPLPAYFYFNKWGK